MRNAFGNKHRKRSGSRVGRVVAATTLLLLAAVAAPAAAAGNDRYKSHPGYVDGAGFVELADPRGQLVEVTLHGRLLHLITQRAIRRHDEELGAILEDLQSMQAIIASLREQIGGELDQKSAERANDMVVKLGAKLVRDGWDRFVRIREGGGEELLAFAHITGDGRSDDKADDERLDGLVVMGITGGSELLFVNLAGDIDMAAVAVLGERFDIPGLDDLPGDDEIKKQHRKRTEARKPKEAAPNNATAGTRSVDR